LISFKWRNGDPALGRFFGVDPIAESFYYMTPYQFASNNPVWKIEIEGLEGLEGILAKNKKSIQCIKKKWFDGGKTEISVYVTPINGKFISCQPKEKMKKRFNINQEIVLPISNFTLLQEKYLEKDNISSFLKYTDFSDYSKQNRIW